MTRTAIDGTRELLLERFEGRRLNGPNDVVVHPDGHVWFAPDGARIGMIHLPEPCSNLCFGGRKRNRLFMTGGQSLYALYLETHGAPYA